MLVSCNCSRNSAWAWKELEYRTDWLAHDSYVLSGGLVRQMMGESANPYSQHKIVILNPKGGSGKTTLATNLASYFAKRGPSPVLVDCDPGGYSMRWLDKRPANLPTIHGIVGYDRNTSHVNFGEAFPQSKEVIIDLPAAVRANEIYDHIYDATSILLPVVASEIDISSAAKFVADLLLFAQLDRGKRNLAIVANRTRQRTKSYSMLTKFLSSLRIPVAARLRDSQVFVHAAAYGLGISDMPAYKVRQDMEQFELIVNWLDRWRSRELDALIAEETNRDAKRSSMTPTAALRH